MEDAVIPVKVEDLNTSLLTAIHCASIDNPVKAMNRRLFVLVENVCNNTFFKGKTLLEEQIEKQINEVKNIENASNVSDEDFDNIEIIRLNGYKNIEEIHFAINCGKKVFLILQEDETTRTMEILKKLIRLLTLDFLAENLKELVRCTHSVSSDGEKQTDLYQSYSVSFTRGADNDWFISECWPCTEQTF